MSFIMRALPLLLTGAGATFSPQGVKKITKFYNNIFNAPPSQSVTTNQVTESTEDISSSSEGTIGTTEVSQPTTQAAPTPQPPPVKPVPPPPPPIMQVLKEAGYEGCELLKGLRGKKFVLYVCWKEGNPKTPSLFHYDRTKVKLVDGKAKADQIISITYNSSNSVMMKFKEDTSGKEHKLDNPLPWMRKFEGQTLNPESECKFEKDDQYRNSSAFTLNCKGQPVYKGIQI
ncbi:hypothetical protein [Mycoplasma wenyonii]|nr:hypothetical protein [Mycoplasma wenyonii]